MTIVLRDKQSGEFATKEGWSVSRAQALLFPTLVEAQAYCVDVRARRVEAVVERPDGDPFAISLLDFS